MSSDLLFFRLKKPYYAIAGYGFSTHFAVVDLHSAWDALRVPLEKWRSG